MHVGINSTFKKRPGGLYAVLDLLPDEIKYSFMDNGKAAAVTSLQSARYRYLKCGRSPEKVIACISPGYILSLNLVEIE